MKNKKLLALCLMGLLFSCNSQKVVSSVGPSIGSEEIINSQSSLEGDSITSNEIVSNNQGTTSTMHLAQHLLPHHSYQAYR